MADASNETLTVKLQFIRQLCQTQDTAMQVYTFIYFLYNLLIISIQDLLHMHPMA